MSNQGSLVKKINYEGSTASSREGYEFEIINNNIVYDLGFGLLVYNMDDLSDDFTLVDSHIYAFGDDAYYYLDDEEIVKKSNIIETISLVDDIPAHLGPLRLVSDIIVNDKYLLTFVLLEYDEGLLSQNIVMIHDRTSLDFITYVSDENFEVDIEPYFLISDNLIFFDNILVFAHETDDDYPDYDKFYIYEIDD